MKISVMIEFSLEEDGYDGSLIFTREDVSDLTTTAQFFGDVVRGAGYGYVDDVGFSTDKGNEFWGVRF
jgi:hypothetical protein